MVPSSITSGNIMKKLIIAVAAVAISTSAMAWGPREQSALTGLVIGAVVASQYDAPAPRHQRRYEPVYVQPQPVYMQPYQAVCGYNVWCPAPVVQQSCFQQQVVDQYGRTVGARTICN